MTVLVSKIRLGAPDAMVLFGNSVAPVDLGASMGGAELDYNPTVFQVEIDQAIMPVNVFRTKEEISFTVGLTQMQMGLVQSAFAYAQSVATTAAAALVTPAAPVIANVGTSGAATWSYKVIAVSSAGDSIPSAAGSTATGNATLTASNYNTITFTAQTNDAVYAYKIKRTAVGTSPSTLGIIGTFYIGVAAGQTLVLNDTGLAAVTYTDIAANPTAATIDKSLVGGGSAAGGAAMAQGSFDWTVPKQDGTAFHIRGHFNNVASYKAIKIDFKREKASEIAKVSFLALADLTQPVGQQAGYLLEER